MNKIHCGPGPEINILVALILLHLFFGQTVTRKQLLTRSPGQVEELTDSGVLKCSTWLAFVKYL